MRGAGRIMTTTFRSDAARASETERISIKSCLIRLQRYLSAWAIGPFIETACAQSVPLRDRELDVALLRAGSSLASSTKVASFSSSPRIGGSFQPAHPISHGIWSCPHWLSGRFPAQQWKN